MKFGFTVFRFCSVNKAGTELTKVNEQTLDIMTVSHPEANYAPILLADFSCQHNERRSHQLLYGRTAKVIVEYLILPADGVTLNRGDVQQRNV